MCNRVLNQDNTSGYKGVAFDKGSGRWKVDITVNRQRHAIGRFSTRREAAIAYNEAAVRLQGEFARLNDIPPEPTQDDPPLAQKRPKKTSTYRGVHLSSSGNRWTVSIHVGGRKGKGIYIGCFVDEIEAARAYDTAALLYFGDHAHLNFPVSVA
jgi:hypothetical protein